MKSGVNEIGDGFPVKVARLYDLVEYQKDSIVSRTVIDKENGTVTLFAFDEGQGLNEHTVPFDAMVFLLDGEAEVMISSENYLVRKGEMIIMSANKPHALKALHRFKMVLVMIRS